MRGMLIASVFGLFLISGAASAASTIIASDEISGGEDQDTATCYFQNVGREPVALDHTAIEQDGADIGTASNCPSNGGKLAPGDICTVSGGSAKDKSTPVSCTARASGTVNTVVGSLLILDANARTLVWSDLKARLEE